MNYQPSILPSKTDDVLPWLSRELPRIASAINEKSKRLWYASAILTPAQIVANTDDYAPVGLAGALWVRLSVDAPRNLTGIKNPESATPRILILTNTSASTITLKHASVSSAAANRFNFAGAADKTLTQHASLMLGYDITTLVWRSLAT